MVVPVGAEGWLGGEVVGGAELEQAQTSPIAKMTNKDRYILALNGMLMLFLKPPLIPSLF